MPYADGNGAGKGRRSERLAHARDPRSLRHRWPPEAYPRHITHDAIEARFGELQRIRPRPKKGGVCIPIGLHVGLCERWHIVKFDFADLDHFVDDSNVLAAASNHAEATSA
jgi:hypothetical protein